MEDTGRCKHHKRKEGEELGEHTPSVKKEEAKINNVPQGAK